MAKRGRSKGSLKSIPHNITWWKWTLLKPSEIIAFIEKGDNRQKNDMRSVLRYLKLSEPEFFEKINGKEILRRLK